MTPSDPLAFGVQPAAGARPSTSRNTAPRSPLLLKESTTEGPVQPPPVNPGLRYAAGLFSRAALTAPGGKSTKTGSRLSSRRRRPPGSPPDGVLPHAARSDARATTARDDLTRV